jgi:cell division inhibitor SepF
MGAMYRLKAYFGMVPADELGEYVDDPGLESYGPPRRAERPSRESEGAWEERSDRRWADDERDLYDDEWERRPARPAAVERPATTVRDHVRATGMASGMASAPVRGALAIDPDTIRREASDREFHLREAPVPAPVPPPSVPEQRDRGAAALARITTLQPRSYNEARTIGERYRDGVPVIMNLTELDDAAAKRLVDFAAGLAFALRGSIDKVTNRVFLLTPADVEVSADDARMLAKRSVGAVNSPLGAARVDAERGLFRQD